MGWEHVATYLKLPVFALVASRLGGLIMFQPGLGGQAIPANVRALLVLGLAAMVTPFVHLPDAAPLGVAAIATAIGRELLLGVLLGLVVRMCFLGIQIGGQMIAQESGLAFGQVADPNTGLQLSLISSFFLQLGLVVFLIVGGHRILVAIAIDSFDAIPLLGVSGSLGDGLDMLFDALTLGMQIALRIAAPAIITLFLVNVALGFLARTVPQINVLILGFSIKGLLAFMALAVSIPLAMGAFIEALETTVGWVQQYVATR